MTTDSLSTAPSELKSEPVEDTRIDRREALSNKPDKSIGSATAALQKSVVRATTEEKTKKRNAEHGTSAELAAARAAPQASISSETASTNTLTVRMILAPDPKVRWIAGDAGSIEFSSDGGKTWTHQVSGVSADLLAGAAPGETICWIAGRAGTILRTTDGGTHWLSVISPVQADLERVRAVDALHAQVSDSSGHLTFETADGGGTWERVLPQ